MRSNLNMIDMLHDNQLPGVCILLKIRAEDGDLLLLAKDRCHLFKRYASRFRQHDPKPHDADSTHADENLGGRLGLALDTKQRLPFLAAGDVTKKYL